MNVSLELFGTPTELVMDPVHKGIPFFDYEAKVIDHPLVQRLRFIDQMDITGDVFPGATQTRFLHSLGTMHVAGMMFRALIRSYVAGISPEYTKRFEPKHLEAIQYLHKCLRLSALLHDTGHLPFSHFLEKFLQEQNMLGQKFYRELWRSKDGGRYSTEVPDAVGHEHISVRCADMVLNQVGIQAEAGIDSVDVIALMATVDAQPSERFCNHVYNLITLVSKDPDKWKKIPPIALGQAVQHLLYDIVSSELGADRMDYLLRDSYFSGVEYGVFNLDHLLNTLRIGYESLPTGKPWVGIAVTDKGVYAFEDFLYCRYQMYRHVYNHKTVVGMKWLLEMAMKEIFSDKAKLVRVKRMLSDVDNFEHFTDTFIWEAIREVARHHPNSACGKVIRREHPTHLAYEIDCPVSKVLTTRAQLIRDTGTDVVVCEAKTKFSDISKKYDNLRVIHETRRRHKASDGLNHGTSQTSLGWIGQESDFYKKFPAEEVTHFFSCPLAD